jgi:flagellum-specific ATP synthase
MPESDHGASPGSRAIAPPPGDGAGACLPWRRRGPGRRVPLGRAGSLTGVHRHLGQALDTWRQAVAARDPVVRRGRVSDAVGLVIEAMGPAVELGELVVLTQPGPGAARALAECVGFRGGRVLLMPLESWERLAPGARVSALGRRLTVGCGPDLLGRVLDGLGRPLDGGRALRPRQWRPVEAEAPPALSRRPIASPLPVGVRAVDALLTCGRGQRLGIFAGSGVGKSTLLGMFCRHTAADVVVVALVGERGREVREFLEGDLGPAALRRATVVVATSDQPAVTRVKAALVATTVAEYFRDQGADVLLVMDSLTRFALALREVGLASGEPPTTRGYTPSVFAALPRLVERSGTGARGSITAFYTVLVEGDDMNEPVADTVRGLLDGHVVLARDIAARGRYPAIDVLQSVSRLQPRVVDAAHLAAAQRVRAILATMHEAQDLVDVGAYRSGANPAVDWALRWIEPVHAFLRQERDRFCPWEETRAALLALGVDAAAPEDGAPASAPAAAGGEVR